MKDKKLCISKYRNLRNHTKINNTHYLVNKGFFKYAFTKTNFSLNFLKKYIRKINSFDNGKDIHIVSPYFYDLISPELKSTYSLDEHLQKFKKYSFAEIFVKNNNNIIGFIYSIQQNYLNLQSNVKFDLDTDYIGDDFEIFFIPFLVKEDTIYLGNKKFINDSPKEYVNALLNWETFALSKNNVFDIDKLIDNGFLGYKLNNFDLKSYLEDFEQKQETFIGHLKKYNEFSDIYHNQVPNYYSDLEKLKNEVYSLRKEKAILEEKLNKLSFKLLGYDIGKNDFINKSLIESGYEGFNKYKYDLHNHFN